MESVGERVGHEGYIAGRSERLGGRGRDMCVLLRLVRVVFAGNRHSKSILAYSNSCDHEH